MPETNTNISAAVQEISDKAQLLVREEIELAKLEITQKATKLAGGAAIGPAAGVFALLALFLILHGLAWLAWYVLFDSDNYFWGFFIIAGLLLVLAGVA